MNVGMSTLWVSPVSSLNLPPPGGARNAGRLRMAIGQQTGEDERPAEVLCVRDVSGGCGELVKTSIRHTMRIDPEGVQRDAVERPFPVSKVANALVRAHQEVASGQKEHSKARGIVRVLLGAR